MVNILEIDDGRPRAYFSGDHSDLCGVPGTTDLANETSAQMRADWPAFPRSVREAFFCS